MGGSCFTQGWRSIGNAILQQPTSLCCPTPPPAPHSPPFYATLSSHIPPPHLSGHDPPQQLHQHWLQQQGGSTRYRPQCQLQSRVQHQHAALAHPADEAAEDGDDVLRGKMWT